jgi:isoleucyl-tRNA synthetase
MNFPDLEKKILKFWQKKRIFEKSIEQRKKAQRFVFYQGPPYLNGNPHLGHFLTSIIKDLILRYKVMRGYNVTRKAGWDTHGLPTEVEVEKKLKIDTKEKIEKIGLLKFIKECKKSVFSYKPLFEKSFQRMGFWLEYKNPYLTCSNDYIETLWFILKNFYQKGYLKEEFRVLPYCPRCQTSLSQAELGMPDAYKEVLDPSIFVKFKIQNSKFKVSLKVYFLVWTTTPWTLPGNVAIAVKPEAEYVLVKTQNAKRKTQNNSSKLKAEEYLILAKERLSILKDNYNYKIIKEFKGKDLVKREYKPLYPIVDSRLQTKSYKILPADFVSMEEGTGLVHIAPAFGEEDLNLAKKYDLPIINYLKEDGHFQEKAPIAKNLYFKEADKIIFEDLKKRGLIFQGGLSQYSHPYPHCWRCKSPLFYWAQKSWILKTSKFKEKLLKENQKINWYPPYLKEGRFGKWLAEGKDWNLGRKRYWGTPLPVWRCQTGNFQFPISNFQTNSKFKIQNSKQCENVVVIGSKEDLLKQKFSSNQYFLLRHGETIYQTKKKGLTYSSWLAGIGLTKKGQKEIEVLAKRLKSKKIDLIFSSGIQRAKETAEILAKELNCPIIFDKRLRDINVGIYYGKSERELYRDYPISVARFDKKIPQGESWLDCQKRMVNFIEEIDKKYQNKKILILSHGDPLWLLEGAMKGKSKKELIEEKLRKKIIKPGELRKLDFKILPYNQEMELDFHRPYIDRVKFFCPKCQNLMERVPEVIDCWFDSGAMPFAQIHWPFCCQKYRNVEISKYRNVEISSFQQIIFVRELIKPGVGFIPFWLSLLYWVLADLTKMFYLWAWF